MPARPARPLVAITTDLITHNAVERDMAARAYAARVREAGGLPVNLPVSAGDPADIAHRFDAFVFTGGDDPKTELFGVPTHAAAVPVHPDRQAWETDLLRALAAESPDTPVLGVCLGMQMMALLAGGSLNQHLPDTHATAAEHWEREHDITPAAADRFGLQPGTVHSKHRQAIDDPGSLTTLATAHDGVIEVIADEQRPFYLGVQWHPERTAFEPLGVGLFTAMVRSSLSEPGA